MQIDTILVVGCGGTGSFLIPPLTRFLLSQNFKGMLILCDGDSYSESNKTRQNFNTKFINVNKSLYQHDALISQLPEVEPFIDYMDKYLSKDDIDELVQENTLIVNCSDNIPIRKHCEDKILQLNNGCHICLGNEKLTGQAQISLRINSEQITPSIFVRSPEFDSTEGDRSVMNCEELSNLESGGQTIGANFTSAALALNYVMMLFSKSPIHNNNWIPCGSVFFDCTHQSFEREDVLDFANCFK